MTTSTERLRKQLDERGVEWSSELKGLPSFGSFFGVTFVGDWYFCEYATGELSATCKPVLTPEQAIAATLGNRTCEYAIKDNMNETEGMGDVWIECSACHCAFDYYADEWLMNMHYCPNCGAKVIGGNE